jgi:hypothetical protein
LKYLKHQLACEWVAEGLRRTGPKEYRDRFGAPAVKGAEQFLNRQPFWTY